jgi:hypothetical protein
MAEADNDNNTVPEKFPKKIRKSSLSATLSTPTWTSPVFKARKNRTEFRGPKLGRSVLGEIQVVSAVRFVEQTTPTSGKTTARSVGERNNTTG